MCSCPKISRNVFIKKIFLVLILQSVCFVSMTWKRKHTIEQQPHGACEWTKSNKQTKKITPYSNWPRVLLFDSAHKQCNGIIKEWLHCLRSESTGRFLANNILLEFSLINKIKIGLPEHSLTPRPLCSITSHFYLTTHPRQSGRYMCITLTSKVYNRLHQRHNASN